MIEVYVDATNKVVSNSPLVQPITQMKAYVYDYVDEVVQPRKDIEKLAKAFADRAKKHSESVHNLYPILKVIHSLQDDDYHTPSDDPLKDVQRTPVLKRARTNTS